MRDYRCISLRGMRFRALPARDAFCFGAWVSGRARREMHFASGHGLLGAPAGGGNTLRGMGFRACPAGAASRFGACISGRARRKMHHASGYAFQGAPGEGGISIKRPEDPEHCFYEVVSDYFIMVGENCLE